MQDADHGRLGGAGDVIGGIAAYLTVEDCEARAAQQLARIHDQMKQLCC